jgi:hypothetical protein
LFRCLESNRPPIDSIYQEKYQRHVFVGYRQFQQFDYLFVVICVDSVRINYIAPLRVSTVPCHARGLATAHSRKLSAMLRGSTSTRPGVRKITLKTCDFVDMSNMAIPTVLGSSTTTSPPIVIVILRQQLDYVIVDYAVLTTPHPIKAKFFSYKSRFLFTFCRTRHSGAPP